MLPKAFERCGHKGFDPDCVLWQFRKANRLATVAWQQTKEGFGESVMKMEDAAFEGLDELESAYLQAGSAKKKAKLVDAYTAKIHSMCVEEWEKLEAKYWGQFGRGF